MKALPEGIIHDHISAVNSKKTGKLFYIYLTQKYYLYHFALAMINHWHPSKIALKLPKHLFGI
jgi:hypothetical protein